MPARRHDKCQVGECNREHHARGYCLTHYAQYKRGAPICEEIKTRDRNQPEECTEEGCSEPVKSKGLCKMHYARLLRHGYTQRPNRTKPEQKCSIPGCDNILYSTGMCNTHYLRVRTLKQYGMTLQDYDRMHAAQGGVCLICKKPERSTDGSSMKTRDLAIDHCHTHGHVRGLLCSNCNRAIGMFCDNPEYLRRAADYLERGAEGL